MILSQSAREKYLILKSKRIPLKSTIDQKFFTFKKNPIAMILLVSIPEI